MRTKSELAKEMIGKALNEGVKAAWVVADSVYGDSRRLGMFLEEREQPYVLAVSGKAYVWAGFHQYRVSTVLSRATDGLRSAQALVPNGLVPAACALGSSAPLVGVAPSSSGRSEALSLRAQRCAAGMNYNCSIRACLASNRVRLGGAKSAFIYGEPYPTARFTGQLPQVFEAFLPRELSESSSSYARERQEGLTLTLTKHALRCKIEASTPSNRRPIPST